MPEKPFESLGYKQCLQHLRGEISLESALESTIVETRQYATRQLTRFRRDTRVAWLEGFGENSSIMERAAHLVREFIAS
jgi:tRNA dimethylallyltransferase